MTPTAALSNPRVALASAGMILAFALMALGSSPAAISVAPDASSTTEAKAAYAKLPFAFVPNRGQYDARVLYATQGTGFGFFFTEKRALFSFSKGKRGTTLALRFPGASPDVRLEGTRSLPGKVNYLIGSDRSSWQRNVPTFGELRYHALWPGIDLVLRGDGSQLKYEFHLAPGARASDIRLAYAGASGLSLTKGGALRIGTPLGTLTDKAPRSFQPAGGNRTAVTSRYMLHGTSGYGFALGRYDRSRPLVIDPGLVYSTYLGGTANEQQGSGFGFVVDPAGNAYVAGDTRSLDYPATPGTYDTTFNGASDVVVTKLNPSGTALVYSTFIGGTGNEAGRALAVDSAGNAYVGGRTASANFPVTPGAFDTTNNGGDAFVAKLNPSGSALVYSTFLGGSGPGEFVFGIALDSAGNAYTHGATDSPDFPTTTGAFDATFNGVVDADAYVAKLNPSGSALVYSTFLGGALNDTGLRIAVDSARNAYLFGTTSSLDFPATPGSFDTTYNGGAFDAYAAKLNPAGSALVYSTYLGGPVESRRTRSKSSTAGSPSTRLGMPTSAVGRTRRTIRPQLAPMTRP